MKVSDHNTSDWPGWKTFDLFNPTESHLMLRKTVRQFVLLEVEPQAHTMDRQEQFNLPLFRKLGPLGLLGITVDEDFGGSGLDALAATIVHEELSFSDPGFCLAYLAHSMLLVNNLNFNGSEEQKRKFLPALCDGSWVGGMAMSEPHVGTDVLGMQSMVQKTNYGYKLTGRKMWITNGTTDDQATPADLILVYARASNDPKNPMISSFVVEKGFKGFSVGQKIKDKLGMRASNTAELLFDQCEIPDSHLIGKLGDSLLHMMKNLEIERVTLAAMSLGIAKRALQIMNKYAKDRESFGKPLNQFGQIQKMISESFADYRASRSYVYDVARKMNLATQGHRADSDGAKLVATTMAKNVCDRAIQVLGGYGYVGEYVVERLWRDSKLLEIGGGTLEAHQKNITRDLSKNPSALEE